MEKKTSLIEILLGKAAEIDSLGNFKDNSTLKVLIEENRFRQDCRKRALETASTKKIIQNGIAYETGTPEVILKEADKYYNWLISIPEK